MSQHSAREATPMEDRVDVSQVPTALSDDRQSTTRSHLPPPCFQTKDSWIECEEKQGKEASLAPHGPSNQPLQFTITWLDLTES